MNQTYVALGIVAITTGIFLYRYVVKAKYGGCSGGCGCKKK